MAEEQELTAAPEEAPASEDASLAQKSQNPIGDLISLPLQNNFMFNEDSGDLLWNLNIQPVIPISLNDDLNLITRTILPVFAMENSIPGFDSGGIGDLNITAFVSPKADSGFIWGVGPVFSFPTATEDIFGTGKWSMGPSFVGLYIDGPWVAGGLVNNLWSVGGESDRENVNSLLVQPFVNYNFDSGWYAVTAPIITSDWNSDSDDRWTIPLGGGLGKVFRIGNQPINASLQGYYNVERPDGGPEWSIRFQVQFLFPK